MTKERTDRYNELLLKYSQDPEVNELLALAGEYYCSANIRCKEIGTSFISNPYERLVYDLEQREEIIRGGKR